MTFLKTTQGTSRLTSLVAMFEQGAKNEKTSCAAPLSSGRPGKLSASKLQSLQTSSKNLDSQEDSLQQQRKPHAPVSTVNALITSFESRKKRSVGCPIKTPKKTTLTPRYLTTKPPLPRPSISIHVKFPEVTRLVEDIFSNLCNRIEEEEECTLSTCFSDRDLVESVTSTITDDSDDECMSCTGPYTWNTPVSGRIGALWTQEALDEVKFNEFKDFTSGSSLSEICAKRLSHLIGLYEEEDSLNFKEKSSVKDRVNAIMSGLQQQEEEDEESSLQSIDGSVRTCKALIEMTVLKEESFNPTVSMANRAPCIPSTEEQEEGDDEVEFCCVKSQLC